MTVAPESQKLEDGRVVAIAGPVVDVEFPPHALPEINFAVEMDLELDGKRLTVTGEVAQTPLRVDHPGLFVTASAIATQFHCVVS